MACENAGGLSGQDVEQVARIHWTTYFDIDARLVLFYFWFCIVTMLLCTLSGLSVYAKVLGRSTIALGIALHSERRNLGNLLAAKRRTDHSTCSVRPLVLHHRVHREERQRQAWSRLFAHRRVLLWPQTQNLCCISKRQPLRSTQKSPQARSLHPVLVCKKGRHGYPTRQV